MPIKVAINGFGRIGKLFLRLAMQRPNEIQVVAINDPKKEPSQFVYFFKHDSVHGEFQGEVSTDSKFLYVKGSKIALFRESLPGNIPWSQFGATVVLESSGMFTRKSEVLPHITKGGAKFVLITSPTRDTKTFVVGVNENQWKPDEVVFSMGSALSNALAPLLKPIHERFGIEFASITAIQSMTAQQKPIDSITTPFKQSEFSKEFNMFRLGRGGQTNIIPSSNTVGWPVVNVIPELDG
jgi:glyceraldehyde 3-phosphate dehydrogenase